MPEPKEDPVQPEKEELSEVVVHLDEKNQPIKPAETPKQDESRYVTTEQLEAALERSIKKATAPLYYEMRKVKEPQQPLTPAQPKPEPTEWETKLQKDWKGTVEELADSRVESILKKRDAEQAAQAERARNYQLLEQNKASVLKRHSELNDETSQKAEVYRSVLQEHPEYLTNTYGPILAMRDMEDKLKDMGVLDSPTQKVVEKEVARQARTNGAALPKPTNSSGTKTVTLTKEQKQFCDANGLKYEHYAKHSNRSFKEGVEV